MTDQVSAIVKPVYLVGGAVRDYLLGKTPTDWDYTTPLLPDEIEAQIKAAGKHCYNIGKKFGTVGMKIDGQMIEITTFRTEQYKPRSRKPDVEFVTDITADLSRRDFTFNAMAIRHDGKIIDPFDGQSALSRGVIKAVGMPSHRFKEDPLRLLRMVRFAAQYGWQIDGDTLAAARKMSYKILEVSKERWNPEMDKILMSPTPSHGLSFLSYTRLLNYMFPELAMEVGFDQKNPHHSLQLWQHTLAVVDASPREIHHRWAALLHDVGKPATRTYKTQDHCNYIHHDLVGAEMVEKIGRYLKWSNERRETVKELVLNHMRDDSPLKEADRGAK